jgi:predicted PurR-regulated permease PerM
MREGAPMIVEYLLLAGASYAALYLVAVICAAVGGTACDLIIRYLEKRGEHGNQ